jgi:hypothetical protein
LAVYNTDDISQTVLPTLGKTFWPDQTKNWAAGISTNKHRHLREHMCAVLPRGQNFGRKTQKGPKKLFGAGKIWGRIFTRFIKKGLKRGPKFSEVWFCTKTVTFSSEIVTSN